MTLREFTARAVGVPFKARASCYDGWDCYGLVRRAYRDVYGIDLVNWSKGYDRVNDWRTIEGLFSEAMTDWRKILKPRPGDVAVIFRLGRTIHCGLVLARRRILHVEEGVETVIEPITPSRFRIEGCYRLQHAVLVAPPTRSDSGVLVKG